MQRFKSRKRITRFQCAVARSACSYSSYQHQKFPYSLLQAFLAVTKIVVNNIWIFGSERLKEVETFPSAREACASGKRFKPLYVLPGRVLRSDRIPSSDIEMSLRDEIAKRVQ